MKKKTTSQSAFFNARVLLSFVFCSIGVFLALLGSGAFSTTFAQVKNSAPDAVGPVSEETEQLSPADSNGRFVQLIEFREAGVLYRHEHLENQRFHADAPQAQADLAQIKLEHAAHIQTIAAAIGRQPVVTHHYTVTQSGIATRLTPAEAQIVRMLPGIVSVERERLYVLDTFRSPFFIGADKIWDGTAVPGGVGTRGQGIVVADLDTGLISTHPSFANDASCGHGVGGAPNKLLSSLDCSTTDGTGLCNGPNPDDAAGHGSHTASTAAGNVVPTSASPPPASQIQGIAPCANLRMYKVCPTDTCPGADINAGIDSILLHGDADVVNFSISGGNSPWSDTDRRFLDLVNAGMVVSASAGNTSASIPNPIGNVAHRGPWVQTVAASTKDQAGPGTGDILASFSLRGPIAGNLQNLTKPDVTAPGVNIYAAFIGAYGTLSGTSMSSPHLTGTSALVRALQPTWLPPEVKSAIMMTSFNGGHKENGTTPWDPDDVGTGRADLTQVAKAGLVMNETFANFLAANPATGGDVRTLNIPSVREMNCTPSCVWTRTVRNTKTVPTSWTATGSSINAGDFLVTVSPPTFNFTGNLTETQTLTITATPLVALTTAVSFGQVLLHEASAGTGGITTPDERLTVSIKGLPTGLFTPTPTPPPASPTPSIAPTPVPTPSATPIVSPSPDPTASPEPSTTPRAQAVNLSTRMRVETGDRVGIGGFIVQGSSSKTVLLRAIGPSLVGFGVPAAEVLADPVMELHGPFATITNNNWRDTQEAEIQATGIPPTNDLESAILVTLQPGAYTAIVRGNGATATDRSGVALVEVYDVETGTGPNGAGTASKLGNISTRAFSGLGSNIIIAGFILGNNGGDDNVIIRGLGPSLSSQGVPSPLADPTLELRNSDGTLLVSNNDWQDNPAQAAIITSAGLAPSNALEAAMAGALPPGSYTALLAGLNNGTGIGLLEIYDRGDGSGGAPIPTPSPGSTPSPAPSTTPGGTPVPTPPPASPTPPAASPTPSPAGACTENFDGVTPPALPPGWTATIVNGPPPGWATSNGTPDTVNNAFLADTAVISDKVLDRAGVVISSTAPVLSFRNNFDTEFSDGTYWDGGVLEVSAPGINGGAFTDVTDAAVGGSFVSGPYTGTIDNTANNPLADRDAWSGSSGGYIDTVINLGPNLNGQTVTFRWRMGTDEAAGAPGWRIDTLSITGASCP